MRKFMCVFLSVLLLLAFIPLNAYAAPDTQPTIEKTKKLPSQKAKKSSSDFKPKLVTEQSDKQAIVPTGERKEHHASFRPRPAKEAASEKYASDRLIVKFKNNIKDSSINPLIIKLGLKKTKDLPLINAQVMQITGKSSVEQAIQQLKSSGLVEYAEPDYKVNPTMIPNDPLFGELWGLHNTGQWNGTPDVDINAPEAWDITLGSSDVVVAVIDTGIDINHPELAGSIWINPGEIPGDSIDNDGNGYVDDINGWDFWNGDNTVFDPYDGDDHGTHVAGTIAAATNNAIGIAGIAPNVKIMPLKFLGPWGGYTSDAILAISYAKDKGVKISNNSWGGDGYSQALYNAIAYSGMLFVAAAGNGYGDNNDYYPKYPASYDLPNILSVAACDKQGYLAWFSSYGPTSVDIAAPGVDILSTVPIQSGIGAAVEADTGTSKTVFWGFGLEDMLGAADRADAVARALSHLDFDYAGSLLLVDNDRSSDWGARECNSYYLNALADLGINDVTVMEVGDGYPSATEMQIYDAVIWQTGRYYVLNDSQMYNLEAYLNSGGKLFLAGQDAIFSTYGLYDFAPNYLHADWLGEGTSLTSLEGVSVTAYQGAAYNLGYQDGWDPGIWRDHLASASAYGKVNLMYTDSGASSYAYYNGTSMAAPHASGTAALVLSKTPRLDPVAIKNQIMGTAKPLSGWDGLTVTGGMIDALAALTREPIQDIPGIPYPAPFTYVTGYLDSISNPDNVYSVFLNPGQSLTVSLSGPADADFDLYLYEPGSTTVKTGEGIIAYSDEPNTSEESIIFTATEAGEYYINVWAYEGSGEYTLYASWGNGPGWYDNTHHEIQYEGNWTKRSNPQHYDGSINNVNARGAICSLDFISSGIKLIGYKGPDQGIADIYIDGTKVGSADFYSPTHQYQQVVFETNTLTSSSHNITVKWTGQRSPSAKKTSTNINIDAFQVLPLAPLPPANFNVYVSEDNQHFIFNWNPSPTTGVVGYNIYLEKYTGSQQLTITGKDLKTELSAKDFLNRPASIDGVEFIKQNDELITGLTWTLSTEEFKKPDFYGFHITAVDASGNETPNEVAFWNSWSYTYLPFNLSAANDNATVHLSWDAVDWAGYYLIGRSTMSNPYYYDIVDIVEAPTQTYDDDTTNINTTYYYRVFVVDNDWWYWGWSNEASVTTEVVMPPVNFNVEVSQDLQYFNFTWEPSPSENVVGYNIYLETYDNTNMLDAAKAPDKDLQSRIKNKPVRTQSITASELDGWTFTKLNPELITSLSWNLSTQDFEPGEYQFHITAVNASGAETPHEIAFWDSWDWVVLPFNLSAVAGDGVVNLSWESPGWGYYYYIYRSPTGDLYGYDWEFIAELTNPANSYSDTTVTNDTTYYYIIVAYSIDWWNWAYSTIPSATPGAIAQPVTIENDDPLVQYTGNWVKASNSNASGGTFHRTDPAGNSATLTFQGTGVSVISHKAATFGIADVYINDVKVGSIDYYNPGALWQQTVFSATNLPYGVHTIKIVSTGTKNSSSSGTRVIVDAFVYTP